MTTLSQRYGQHDVAKGASTVNTLPCTHYQKSAPTDGLGAFYGVGLHTNSPSGAKLL